MRSRNRRLAQTLEALEPENAYGVHVSDAALELCHFVDGGIVRIPNPVPASSAAHIANKLYPHGKCTEPVLVAGLDQGWLWKTLYELPIDTPVTPGHRPPLYFLAADLERFWVVLHLHDWRKLLADQRVRLFAGGDCIAQCQRDMSNNHQIPWPKLSITVDAAAWPDGVNVQQLTSAALYAANAQFATLREQIDKHYATVGVDVLTSRFRSGKLRVLGITSRYTSFLQYSMRDWLASFEKLGHETRLWMEPFDCALDTTLTHAAVAAEFKPDLILLLDHYRGQFSGLPANVPCVMWIQDQLAHLCTPAAGAAQKSMDYVIGYGRIESVYRYGYPASRFLPAMIPTNEARFAPGSVSADELARHACDVSFVSHASIGADLIVNGEIARQNSKDAAKVLGGIFEELRSQYTDAGGAVTEPREILRIIRRVLAQTGTSAASEQALLNFFTHRVNNSLFRHQTLHWLADMGVDLHLYGRGWENHPRFKKYARGIADNQRQLCAIYQASRINLQVTPFGAAHQRVFDGVAAGGFFLMRACRGDQDDRLYEKLWQWCEARDIESDVELHSRADDDAKALIGAIRQSTGQDPFKLGYDFVRELHVTALDGFARNASTLFPEYDQVAFASKHQLASQVQHFLGDDAARSLITGSMRAAVLDKVTYTSMTRRLLAFIYADLVQKSAGSGAIAA